MYEFSNRLFVCMHKPHNKLLLCLLVMDFLQFNFMAALQLELYKSQQEELKEGSRQRKQVLVIPRTRETKILVETNLPQEAAGT